MDGRRRQCILRSLIIFALRQTRLIKSRRVMWAERVARMMELRNAYRISVGKPEGKKPLRRLRHGV
jgi:hypothetical protein